MGSLYFEIKKNFVHVMFLDRFCSICKYGQILHNVCVVIKEGTL